jgi:hypothetical protein
MNESLSLAQDGTGDVVAREQEDVQPPRHGEPAHHPGVPEVVDGGDAHLRQRRHVERQVQPLGEALPRPADVHQRHLAGEVAQGRVQHAGDQPPLRQGRRPAHAAVLQPRISPPPLTPRWPATARTAGAVHKQDDNKAKDIVFPVPCLLYSSRPLLHFLQFRQRRPVTSSGAKVGNTPLHVRRKI